MEDAMIKWGETWIVPLTQPLSCGRRVITQLLWIVLAATPAMAQQSLGTVTETVTTRGERDLNGRDVVTERVVTQRTRANDGEHVVVETYLPSIEAGRFALNRRVTRVRTETDDGSQTIEETAERSFAAASEPLSIIQRSVTTVRRRGTDSYVSERHVFERDTNGRFVPVHSQTETHVP
jgi:hypothetical protein